jgi:hypothetical protein
MARHLQTHMPNVITSQVQYQFVTGGSYVAKPAKTLRLVSGLLAIYLEHQTPDPEDNP